MFSGTALQIQETDSCRLRNEAIQKYLLTENTFNLSKATDITVSSLVTKEVHQFSASEKLHWKVCTAVQGAQRKCCVWEYS